MLLLFLFKRKQFALDFQAVSVPLDFAL